MTSRDFCYWLQGFFEVSKCGSSSDKGVTAEQAEIIQRHLNLVFKHEIDPSFGDDKAQKLLNELHRPPHGPSGPETLIRC